MSSSNQSLPSSKERFKYDKACSVTNSILSSYSSIDSLKEKSNIYRRTNDQQYVQAHSDYRKYRYHRNIIKNFDDTFSDQVNPPPQDILNCSPQDNLNLLLQDNLISSQRSQNCFDDETSTSTHARNDMFVHSQIQDNMNSSQRNQNHLDDETSTTSHTRNDMFVHYQIQDNMNSSQRNQNHLDDETSTSTDRRNDFFVHSQTQESFSSLSNQTNYNHHQQQNINENNLESQICKNCHRKQSLFLQDSFNDEDSLPYVISFVQHSTLHIQNRRKFKFVSSTTDEDNAELITLCQECSNHLISDDIKVANKSSNTWPGFIWNILRDKKMQGLYKGILWKFIPKLWRYWWLDEFKNNIHVVDMPIVSIDTPKPLFIDRSSEILQWDKDISSMSLPNLKKACNQCFIPNILCPFGCTEFRHKVGTVSLDIIFQRYLRKSIIKIMNKSEGLKYVQSARDDFIREDDDYDCWALNKDWIALPSIKFVDGTPFVLTCRDHHKGNKQLMIHPPRQPFHNLPSKYSDQLCHCCIRTRTIKPIQRKGYSTAYQMHEQRGTFNGIDTCNITSYRNFNFRSRLLSDSESRAILNRPDINSLLNKIVEEKEVSAMIANDKRRYANQRYSNFDFTPYYEGATYVSIEAAMAIQKDIVNPTITAVVDDRGTDDDGSILPERRVRYKKYWPSFLYPCQRMSPYGTMFYIAPTFTSNSFGVEQNSKSPVIWIVSTALLTIQELWFIIAKRPSFRTTEWYGWLLSYLTKNCLNSINGNQARTDVFKLNLIRSLPRLYDKVMNTIDSLRNAFIDCNNILHIDVVDIDDSFQELLSSQDNLQSKRIVIVEPFYVNDDVEVEESICVNNIEFELRTICHVEHPNNTSNSWKAETFSRHGGMHSSWWFRRKRDPLFIEINSIKDYLKNGKGYILFYVQKKSPHIENLKEEYLKYLGGQSHVKCNDHSFCLITSMDKTLKCQCGKKAYLTCPNMMCNTNICRSCFDNLNILDTHHIDQVGGADENNNIAEVEDDSDDESGSLLEPRAEFGDGDYLFDNDNDAGGGASNIRDEGDGSDSDVSMIEQEAIPQRTSELMFARDNFDEFLTTALDPDLPPGEDNNGNVQEVGGALEILESFQTTNSGEYIIDVREDNGKKGAFQDITINGSTILNQCGTLLTRKKHQVKGSNKQKFFLQKLCATSTGTSVPLLYPEAMLFPSIFWKTASDNISQVGAIPSPLLSERISSFGFSSIPSHVRSRLTSATTTTSTDYHYASFQYDMLTNLSASHEDTRLVLQRGLTVAEDKAGGLGLRGKGDSSMLESFDSKAMVRNLCASQYYHNMDFFLTFTCNMKKHFGTSTIKSWLDGHGWTKNFENYEDLDMKEKAEVSESINQSVSGLLLRVWEEVSQLFIDYLKKSPKSPYKRVLSIFVRKEYQALAGNLSHIHAMLEVDWKKITDEEKEFIQDLCRCSILDIVRPDEVRDLIADGTFENIDEWKDMFTDATKFLGHVCNSRCLRKTADGTMKCRKLNYLDFSKDNTKHTYARFSDDLPDDTLKRLVQIGMVEEVTINRNGFRYPYKSKLAFLHPQRHIPPTNPSDDINMSPCEGYTFSNCLSMQNIQVLTQSGGVNKYVCKYIGKLDEQNYIVVNVDPKTNGSLVTVTTFLHNTKVSSTKINEEKEKNEKGANSYPQGRCITHMEMMHHMLKYPEVITDLVFVTIPSMPLEFRSGVYLEKPLMDSAQVGSVSNDIRLAKGLPSWRLHTLYEMRICEDLKVSKVSIDRVTVYSLRPPELREFVDTTRNYFRWFHIKPQKVKGDIMNDLISDSLYESIWVGNLQQKNLVRIKALPEIIEYIDRIENGQIDVLPLTIGMASMIVLFKKIDHCIKVEESDEDELDEEEGQFYDFAMEHLIYQDDEDKHLPVPVYSYLKPALGVQFIHHILISLGRFSTEIDLTMKPTIRESLRYAKLIGESNEPTQLQKYSDKLLYRWIEEQLQFFPVSRRVMSEWIVIAGELFDSVIVRDEISINDMPAVQLTSLFGSADEEIMSHSHKLRTTFINAIHLELENVDEACNVPSKEYLLEATKEQPLDWNASASFSKNANQSDESFEEQQLAIKTCCDAIDKYCSIDNQLTFTKHIGIRGFPGSGKTWCSLYASAYALSKGLFVLSTAVLAKRAIQLGGIHWHLLFCIPIDRNMSLHRKSELAIISILKDPILLNIVRTLDVLLCDEIGQLSAEFIAIIDNILRRIRDNNYYLGGVLLLCTVDHTQIQSINSRPFLTSSHIIPCFIMVNLQHSVRAFGDPDYQRLQHICRLHYKQLEDKPELVEEFIDLCSQCLTFVDDWSDPKIEPSTMRLYSKKIPAREAANQFAERVRRHVSLNEIRERIADDVEKSQFSQQEWYQASERSMSALDQKVKEPRSLLFFRGAVFVCTFNKKGFFSQAQMAVLFDLPNQEDLDNWRPINVLLAPPGLKEIIFDQEKSKEEYINDGFKEVKVGVCPQSYTQSVANYTQTKRKQYGLKHYVSATIHAAMGDTLVKMATSISTTDNNFSLWDKGQLVVILSRTKIGKNSIFVGQKDETLASFRMLLMKKTQWSDYIEEVLDLVTINNSRNVQNVTQHRVMTQTAFPFRNCDVSLPQCQTGFVYMLLSIRHTNFAYIGTTNCIRTRIQRHNRGTGAMETAPSYLRPFALYAYICGFGGCRRDLRYYIEAKWKEKRDELIGQGINNPREWALSGNDVIQNIVIQNERSGQYNITQNDLTLVCLFRQDE